MPQVMQAACPGCKSVLRIPADWLNQPIRCKCCGTVLQAQTPAPTPIPAPAPAPAPAASARPTPLPLPPRAPAPKAVPQTPAPHPRAAASTPAPPPPPRSSAAVKRPRPVKAAPPQATPLVPRPSASGSPFDFAEPEPDDAPAPSAARRRRRGNGGLLVGVGLIVGLMMLMAGLGYTFWPQIKKTLNESNKVASGSGDLDPDEVSPSVSTKRPGRKVKTTSPKILDKDDKGDKPGPLKKAERTPSPEPNTSPPKKNPDLKPKPTPGGDDPPPLPAIYPRRALVISVHNYLYANPILNIQERADAAFDGLTRALNGPLKVSLTQIYHLSDMAKKNRLPPLKSVIEKSLTNFLKTSRKQDRLMVFFIGHTRLIENEAYLVPVEGDFKEAATLIPLKWVYQQLADCPARQKILVIDGNRFSPAQGEERPKAGPMEAKFEEALRSPPAGVEVWSACSSGQESFEFEDAPLGVFLEGFRLAMLPDRSKGLKGALEGRIQKPNDLIPMKVIHDRTAENMNRELERRKLTQVPKLSGSAPASGTNYDRKEVAALAPAFPTFSPQSQQVVKDILNEISLPAIKGGQGAGDDLNFDQLPPFSPDAIKKFDGTLPADSKLRQAIHKARVTLWAVSTSTAPRDLQADVTAVQAKLSFKISDVMREKYTKPGAGQAETRFKDGVFKDGATMARIVAQLEDVLEEMKAAGEEKDKAPGRWKANYTYVLARLQAQLTYVEEYQGLLGQMRKEFPAMDEKIHNGWRLAAKEKATDSAAKKYFKAARKGYNELATKYRGTPWEVLGKREEMTALGLEWQAY